MTTSSGLETRIETGDAYTTLFVVGEIDYGTVSRLRSVLLQLARDDTPEVVVDLSDVTFIDSTGLSVLVQAKQRFESTGGRMSVTGMQPRVTRVLQLAGLTDYLVGG